MNEWLKETNTGSGGEAKTHVDKHKLQLPVHLVPWFRFSRFSCCLSAAFLGASSPSATPGRTQVDRALRAASPWWYKTIPLCPQTQPVVQRQGLPWFPRHVTSDWLFPLSVKLRGFLPPSHEQKNKTKNRIFPQRQNKFVFYRCTVKHNLIPMNVYEESLKYN